MALRFLLHGTEVLAIVDESFPDFRSLEERRIHGRQSGALMQDRHQFPSDQVRFSATVGCLDEARRAYREPLLLVQYSPSAAFDHETSSTNGTDLR